MFQRKEPIHAWDKNTKTPPVYSTFWKDTRSKRSTEQGKAQNFFNNDARAYVNRSQSIEMNRLGEIPRQSGPNVTEYKFKDYDTRRTCDMNQTTDFNPVINGDHNIKFQPFKRKEKKGMKWYGQNPVGDVDPLLKGTLAYFQRPIDEVGQRYTGPTRIHKHIIPTKTNNNVKGLRDILRGNEIETLIPSSAFDRQKMFSSTANVKHTRTGNTYASKQQEIGSDNRRRRSEKRLLGRWSVRPNTTMVRGRPRINTHRHQQSAQATNSRLNRNYEQQLHKRGNVAKLSMARYGSRKRMAEGQQWTRQKRHRTFDMIFPNNDIEKRTKLTKKNDTKNPTGKSLISDYIDLVRPSVLPDVHKDDTFQKTNFKKGQY